MSQHHSWNYNEPRSTSNNSGSKQPKDRQASTSTIARLPPNSGSPRTAARGGHSHQQQKQQQVVASSSFSSSHSSVASLSPSPSLDPYTGSLRAMFRNNQQESVDNDNETGGSDDHRRHSPKQQSLLQSPTESSNALHATTTMRNTNTNRDIRCEQIIQNFYSKTAQVIAHLRGYTAAHSSAYRFDSTYTDSSSTTPSFRLAAVGNSAGSLANTTTSASSSMADLGSSGRRVNKWFNLKLDDIPGVKEEVRPWRQAAINAHTLRLGVPPMIIDICLDISGMSSSDELQVIDIFGRPWHVDVEIEPLSPSFQSRVSRTRSRRALAIVLETWTLNLDSSNIPSPLPDLPRVYKHAIAFFRSLYSFANLLPSMSLVQYLQHGSQSLGQDLAVFCSFRMDTTLQPGVIDLDVGLTGTETFLESHSFEPIATPMGTLDISVQYRRECMFNIVTTHGGIVPVGSYGGSATASAVAEASGEPYFTPTLSSRSGSNTSTAQHYIRRAKPHSAMSTLAWRRSTSSGAESSNIHPSRRTKQPVSFQQPRHVDRSISRPLLEHGRNRDVHSSGNIKPSVNPFKTRPLSIGSDMSASKRITTGSLGKSSALSDSLGINIRGAHSAETTRRILGPGSQELARQRRISSGSSTYGRGIDGRASGSSEATTSMLHRNVMLRRLGGSLSPTEPNKYLEGSASSFRPSHIISPPSKPNATTGGGTSRLSSSGGSTESVSRPSIPGLTPFRSPSLSESPHGTITTVHTGVVERPRGHTVSNDYSLDDEAQQILTKLSGSPSSFGSNTASSTHSRRLSSSFGNRRASLIQRHRHASSNLAGSTKETPETAAVAQDIDDFIRMVDAKKPLSVYSRDSASSKRQQQSVRRKSLDSYQQVLNQFTGISIDMESSILTTTTAPNKKGNSVDMGSIAPEELSSSPFRRLAIPNPLKGNESLITANQPATTVEGNEENKDSNISLLRQAFDGLLIESQPTNEDDEAATFPVVVRAKPHMRNAAAGLDYEREHPLPPPVAIPRARSGMARPSAERMPHRRQRQKQTRQPSDGTALYSEEMRASSNSGTVRGKSQPLLHAPELGSSHVVPRLATPQPPASSMSPGSSNSGRSSVAAAAVNRGDGGELCYQMPSLPLPLPLPQPLSLSGRNALHSSSSNSARPAPAPAAARFSPEFDTSHKGGAPATADMNAVNGRLGAWLGGIGNNGSDKLTTTNEPSRSTPVTPAMGSSPSRPQNSSHLHAQFPPLSFIVPRSRMDPHIATPPLADGGISGSNGSNQDDADADDSDEDLMFEMDSSIN